MLPYFTQSSYEQSLKNIIEQANGQLQQMQTQKIQPPITQNFQLAGNFASNFKLVNDIEDVKKEVVISDTYFLENSLLHLFIKNTKGDIRTFNLEEIIPKDEKDILIEKLQEEIKELKGGNKHDRQDDKQLHQQPSAEHDNTVRK